MNKRIVTAALIVSIGSIGYVAANTDTKEVKKECTSEEKACCAKNSAEAKEHCSLKEAECNKKGCSKAEKAGCSKSNSTASCEGKKGTCSPSEKKSCSSLKKA